MPMTTLLLLLTALGPAPDSARAPAGDPSIRVWLSCEGEAVYGEAVRVFVQSSENGYVVVLHADPRGRVRVLHPLDPRGDHYARGGQKYEVRGPGGREAFRVDDTLGTGVIVAAVSGSRFLLERFAKGDQWDYRALALAEDERDAEAGLLDLVREMQPDEAYQVDVASYVVRPPERIFPVPRRYPRPWPWPRWWW